MAINLTYQVYTGGRWLPNVTNLTDYAGIYGQSIQAVIHILAVEVFNTELTLRVEIGYHG